MLQRVFSWLARAVPVEALILALTAYDGEW